MAKQKTNPLDIYKEQKLKMLTSKHEFGFKLSESEIEYLNSLTSEVSVDNYSRRLIMKYL